VFVKVTELGTALSYDVAPAVLDTAEDYMIGKASVYGDIDGWKHATGISWGFTQTIVKHAIGLGFKLAGHKPADGWCHPDEPRGRRRARRRGPGDRRRPRGDARGRRGGHPGGRRRPSGSCWRSDSGAGRRPQRARPMPLPATEAALSLFARRLLARTGKGWRELLRVLPEQEPLLARLLRDAMLHAYVTSAKATARPALPRPLVAGDSLGPPLRPPFGPGGAPTGAGGEGDDGPIRYPGMEAAARWLRRRRLVTADEFQELTGEAQRAAFTVARTATLDAVERVREAVADAYERGGSLRKSSGRG
jgi:hypothetical protein